MFPISVSDKKKKKLEDKKGAAPAPESAAVPVSITIIGRRNPLPDPRCPEQVTRYLEGLKATKGFKPAMLLPSSAAEMASTYPPTPPLLETQSVQPLSSSYPGPDVSSFNPSESAGAAMATGGDQPEERLARVLFGASDPELRMYDEKYRGSGYSSDEEDLDDPADRSFTRTHPPLPFLYVQSAPMAIPMSPAVSAILKTVEVEKNCHNLARLIATTPVSPDMLKAIDYILSDEIYDANALRADVHAYLEKRKISSDHYSQAEKVFRENRDYKNKRSISQDTYEGETVMSVLFAQMRVRKDIDHPKCRIEYDEYVKLLESFTALGAKLESEQVASAQAIRRHHSTVY